MRCIWIADRNPFLQFHGRINRNMRCIWMHTRRIYPPASMDKQEHEMYLNDCSFPSRIYLPAINRNMRCIWIHIAYFRKSPFQDKQEHEMYLNCTDSQRIRPLFPDKQEHEMYLNLKTATSVQAASEINRNMRCIWIGEGNSFLPHAHRINRNMRCIWIAFSGPPERTGGDKQEHEMYLNGKRLPAPAQGLKDKQEHEMYLNL